MIFPTSKNRSPSIERARLRSKKNPQFVKDCSFSTEKATHALQMSK